MDSILSGVGLALVIYIVLLTLGIATRMGKKGIAFIDMFFSFGLFAASIYMGKASVAMTAIFGGLMLSALLHTTRLITGR